jgi:hypothetical protein
METTMSCETQTPEALARIRRAYSISSPYETLAVSVCETEEEILARALSEDHAACPVCPRFDAEFEACQAASLNYL